MTCMFKQRIKKYDECIKFWKQRIGTEEKVSFPNFTRKSGEKKLQECKTKKFLLTICTSLTELMLRMYIVTPTVTGGPRSKIQ